MNAPASFSAARAYAQVGNQTGIEAASPHRLIAMLFDGAVQAVRRAMAATQANDIATKGGMIGNAIAIILEGLKASLNLQEGGELAARLDALYEYMGNELLLANLHSDTARMQKVLDLLLTIKEGWDGIDPHAAAAPSAVQPEARAAASYGKA